MELRTGEQRQGSCRLPELQQIANWWRGLWKLQVQPKIQVFGWRVFRRAIPTKEHLHSKGADVAGSCYICGDGEETTQHVFFECRFMKTVLFIVDPSIDLSFTDNEIWIKKFSSLMQHLSKEQIKKILVLRHHVWETRNAIWQGKMAKSSGEVGQMVLQHLVPLPDDDEVSLGRILDKGRRHNWNPPPQSLHKLNVDAALNTAQHSAGIGVIVRDECGQFMAAKTLFLHGVSNPRMAELLVAREGLVFAWEAGFKRVFLEGDAKTLYSSIRNVEDDLSANESILRDILMYVSWFVAFDCDYVSRDCNKVADSLANIAIAGDSSIWLEDPPEAIEALLLGDLIV